MRRSWEDISAGILKSCVAGRLTVSQLMVGQNLTHKSLMVHLRHLVSIDLVEVDAEGRRKVFSTTERGIMALKSYRDAMAILRGEEAPRLVDERLQKETIMTLES